MTTATRSGPIQNFLKRHLTPYSFVITVIQLLTQTLLEAWSGSGMTRLQHNTTTKGKALRQNISRKV